VRGSEGMGGREGRSGKEVMGEQGLERREGKRTDEREGRKRR